MPSEMPRMIGDFDDNANAMWSLHLSEAKSHDEARIHSLKDDMDSVLIFVRVYTSIITVFCRLMHFRPAYSPLPSLPFLSIASTAFRTIQHSRWSSTNNRMSLCSLRSPSRSPLSLHWSPFHPLHFRHTISMQVLRTSGSMFSGS